MSIQNGPHCFDLVHIIRIRRSKECGLRNFFILLGQKSADFVPATQHQINPHPFDLRVLLLDQSSADWQKFEVGLKEYDLKASLMHLETIRQRF